MTRHMVSLCGLATILASLGPLGWAADGDELRLEFVMNVVVTSKAETEKMGISVAPGGKDLLVERLHRKAGEWTLAQVVSLNDDPSSCTLVGEPDADGVWRANARVAARQASRPMEEETRVRKRTPPEPGRSVISLRTGKAVSEPAAGEASRGAESLAVETHPVVFEDEEGNRLAAGRILSQTDWGRSVPVSTPGIAKLFAVSGGRRLEIGSDVSRFQHDAVGERVFAFAGDVYILCDLNSETVRELPIRQMDTSDSGFVISRKYWLVPGRDAVVAQVSAYPPGYHEWRDGRGFLNDPDYPVTGLRLMGLDGEVISEIWVRPDYVAVSDVICSQHLIAFFIREGESRIMKVYTFRTTAE